MSGRPAIDAVFASMDDLGPAKIVHVHEPRSGLRAVLVVDNVARGPSIGGGWLRTSPLRSASGSRAP